MGAVGQGPERRRWSRYITSVARFAGALARVVPWLAVKPLLEVDVLALRAAGAA